MTQNIPVGETGFVAGDIITDAEHGIGRYYVTNYSAYSDTLLVKDLRWRATFAVYASRSAHVCANCDMRLTDHAENGKCLYAPTCWKKKVFP